MKGGEEQGRKKTGVEGETLEEGRRGRKRELIRKGRGKRGGGGMGGRKERSRKV